MAAGLELYRDVADTKAGSPSLSQIAKGIRPWYPLLFRMPREQNPEPQEGRYPP